MSDITLSHIVPALPPQIDGVGDHALNLALQLRQSQGIQSRFVVCDPDWDGPGRVQDFEVRRLRLRNEAGIWSLLAAAKEPHSYVLLHYLGHAYNTRGLPFWLCRGIESWLAERSSSCCGGGRQFSTLFHELWQAPAQPGLKGFCNRFLQKRLVQRLHRRSNLSVVNTRGMQARLDVIEPHKTLCLPMPSNLPVTEPAVAASRSNTRLRIAIFDAGEARSATVRAHTNLLTTLDRKQMVANTMLLGNGRNPRGLPNEDLALLQACIPRERIEVLGELAPAAVAEALGRADLFLSHQSGELACKSGAFMSALASGCPAVLRDGRNAAPLNESEHFIASDDSAQSVARFEQMTADGHLGRIGLAGRMWYNRFADWKVISTAYHAALFQRAARPKESVRSAPAKIRTAEGLAAVEIRP